MMSMANWAECKRRICMTFNVFAILEQSFQGKRHTDRLVKVQAQRERETERDSLRPFSQQWPMRTNPF